MLIYPLLILLCAYAEAIPLSIDGDMFYPQASKTMRRAAGGKKVAGKESDDLLQVPENTLNSSNQFQQSRVNQMIEEMKKKMPKLPYKHEPFKCKAMTCSRGCARGPGCCAEAMFNMLNATSALLRKHNIDHFIWAGTLLGGFRGHDIIQTDTDMDLVISEQGIKFLFHQTEIPYRFFWDNGGLMRGCQMFQDAKAVAVPNDYDHLKKSTLIYMDLYPMQAWALVVNAKQHLGPGYHFRPHSQISIRNESFPGPKDPEKVLIDLYGPGWKTPSKNHADNEYKNRKGASMLSWRPNHFQSNVIMACLGVLVLLMLIILCATLKASPNTNANQSTAATLVWQSAFSRNAIVFWASAALWICMKFCVAATKTVSYSVMFMIFLISILKLMVSIVLYRCEDGPLSTFSAMIRCPKFQNLAVSYAVPAGLFCLTDLLNILCWRRADPVTVTLLANMRNVILTVLWPRMFNQRLAWMQIAGITIMCAGMTGKELVSDVYDNRQSSAGSHSIRMEVYLYMFVSSIASVVASLYNEKFLKGHTYPLNAQNMVMYMYSILFSLLGHVIYTQYHPHTLLLPFGAPPAEQTLYGCILLISTTFGLATSRFFKCLGNVARIANNATVVVVSMPLQAMLFGYTFGLAERFAIMMTIFGLSVYGLGSHKATEQEKNQPESHQQHQNAPASPTSEVTAEASGASAASPSLSSEVTNEPVEPVQASPALTSEVVTS